MTDTDRLDPTADADEREVDPALVARVGRPAKLAITAVVVLALTLAVGWYVSSPTALPTASSQIGATTPVGEPVYLGVFTAGAGFDRTLHLAGVKVHTTSNTAVDVVPLLCRGADLGVTSDPQAFCDELVNPEGQDFGPNDSIVLQVSADEPAIAVVDPVRVAFREGVQWATLEAGVGSVVRIVAR